MEKKENWRRKLWDLNCLNESLVRNVPHTT